jgi:uncharacterized protein (UPF0216 family)
MATRNEKVLRCIDPAIQAGGEIDSLDKPVVTRETGQVYYIDRDTTEALRDRFSAPNPSVDIHKLRDMMMQELRFLKRKLKTVKAGMFRN